MTIKRLASVLVAGLLAVSLLSCGNINRVKDAGSAALKSQLSETSKTTETEPEDHSDSGAVSCNYNIETGNAYLNAQDDEGNDLIRVSYPKVTLSEDSGYEVLEQSLEELNQERKETAEQDFADYKKQAEEECVDNADFMPYEMSVKYYVRRADSAVLSLCSYAYDYTGGAHGFYSCEGINYDVETGEKLSLSEIVKDYDQLKDVLTKVLREDYPDVDFFELENTLSSYEEQDFFWCLDYTGITFFFNPYELASYADGAQTVTLSFADYPELFSSDYRDTAEAYCVDLVPGQEYGYELDEDGDTEILQCDNLVSEEDPSMCNPVLTLSGEDFSKEITDDEYCTDMDAVLFHLSDGSNYVYIMKMTDNDYESATVYKISNHKFKKAGTLNLGFRTEKSGDFTLTTRMTNPAAFEGEIRSDALSTYAAYTTYHMGVDGLPVMDSDWYVSLASIELQLETDMTFDLLDEDGIMKGTANLKKDTKMTILRTDNKSFVDLMTADKEIVRAEVNLDADPMTVNGTDYEKVFSGMKFAG